MYSLSQAFHRARRQRSQAPVVLVSLTNAFGLRVYSDRYPTDATLGLVAVVLANGQALADGTCQAGAGSQPLLERGAKVLSFGRLRETLSPLKGALLASLAQEEAGTLSLVLSNGGAKGQRPFSRLEALENLLGAQAEIRVGYAGLEARDFLRRFAGRVVSYRLEAEQITLSLKAL